MVSISSPSSSGSDFEADYDAPPVTPIDSPSGGSGGTFWVNAPGLDPAINDLEEPKILLTQARDKWIGALDAVDHLHAGGDDHFGHTFHEHYNPSFYATKKLATGQIDRITDYQDGLGDLKGSYIATEEQNLT
jgi:hypothetical protein